MKLLLDENLSRRLVPFLVHDYPGTSQVTLLGMEQASDTALWQYAKTEGFVIVTRDADFQEIATDLALK
jgi:predicted nuclease of predicted toxin-antitoxin system